MAVDQLSSVFMALADPTRRAILARLIEGDANVSELAAPFSISQPAISKHLKVLERAGLISRNRAATARLSHLEAAPMKEATMWMEQYRQYWDHSLDRLDAALNEYMRSEGTKGAGAKGVRTKGASMKGPRAKHAGAKGEEQ